MSCWWTVGWSVRWLLWVVWLCVVFPLHVVELVVCQWFGRFCMDALRDDMVGFQACVTCGLLISYVFFMPLSRLETVSPSILCTLYASLCQWVWGHVLMGFGLHVGCAARIRVVWECHRCYLPKAMSSACYLGLCVGLSFAFPVAALRRLDPSQPVPSVSGWCRPSASWSPWALYIPLFVSGMLDACMDLTVPTHRYIPQEDDSLELEEE